jgi:elongation factor G
MEGRDNGIQAVDAKVPLSSMFGYSTDIRSASQGRATFSMQFADYALVPDKMSKEIEQKVRGFV